MEGGFAGRNLVMLPRDAPTDVLNEIQLVQDFYGADTPADHQRVMALFAPHAQLDLPQMLVSGRNNISAIMFYAKSFLADIDIEPYMVEVAPAGAEATANHTATATVTATTASEAPADSTTSTDSTGSTCTSAATSRRRRPSGKPPKAPSSNAAAGAGPSGIGRQRSARSKQQQPQQQYAQPYVQQQLQQQPQQQGLSSDILPRSRSGRHQQHSDQTDQADGTAQNQSAHALSSMSRTYVYAVATITPKSLTRMLTLNMLPREIRVRTCVTLVWDDEAGEVLLLQERPDNLPVGLIPAVLKRTVGQALGWVTTRSQWLIGRMAATRIVSNRWPGLQQLHGTGL